MRSLALLLALSTLPVHAATYHVDGVAGDDANDGLTKPFKTLGRAVRALQTSDTLVLAKMDQPYRESLPLLVGGTPRQPLVVEGNGATLSGADPAPPTGWQAEAGGVFSLPQATEVKFLLGPECFYEAGKSPTTLGPEQWLWQAGKLYFRPAEGKTPADYRLDMSIRISGVMTTGVGQVIVRNLNCERFYNDGFNIHNGSGPLWFENIRGVWNGDEGFSCHENCECYVRGAELSHNYWHGVADVGLSRTHYQNLIVRDNRMKGLFFLGAMHSVTDAEVSGSPVNIAVNGPDLREYPRLEAYPLRDGVAHFRNVVVRSRGDEIGLQVAARASAVLEHCLLTGGKVALQVERTAQAYVVNSVLAGASQAEVLSHGKYVADYNLYHPGRLVLGDKTFAPADFAAYQQASGNDAHSLCGEPRFIGDSTWLSVSGAGLGLAYNAFGFGGLDPGIENRGPRPAEPDALPLGAIRTPTGRLALSYDFEQTNPWPLIYPEPAQSAAGEAVTFSAALSPAQAHGGTKSGLWQVKVPAGAPATYNLKLFSIKFPYRRPVAGMRFWLYGDGSGRAFRPRVRDAQGESFYGPPLAMDFTGWREVVWDLAQTPPVVPPFVGGNQRQDVPPVEIVLEVSATAGTEVTLYVDDLTVELAPE